MTNQPSERDTEGVFQKKQTDTKLGSSFGAFSELSPGRTTKLFVCIERQERYATVSCALDPEETLLYSKVTTSKLQPPPRLVQPRHRLQR